MRPACCTHAPGAWRGWRVPRVLVGVFPGNVKMAVDAMKTRNQTFKAIALARLPLQLPMIRAALKVAREG